MSDLSEASGHPLASTQLPESTIPTPPTPQHHPTTSRSSDDHITAVKPFSSRRRPASRKQAPLNPNTSSRGDDRSIMQRPDSPSQTSPDSSVHYTRTGRISKAKKGLKVHNCECGRSYTRAEHLRRHQRNHAQDALRCDFPGCGKPFYRLDLLQRHQERHNEPGKEDSPQMYSPVSTTEPDIQLPASTAPPHSMSAPVPQPEPYYTQPVSPSRGPVADPSVPKRGYSMRQTAGATAVPVDNMGGAIAWNDPFANSPYTPPSDGYSPMPNAPDYPAPPPYYANPPYGNGSTRTRTSSAGSYVEQPWGYPPRSPTSATSVTMPYSWSTAEKGSAMAYMTTTYPMTSMPMSAEVDPMTGFGQQYGPKTMAQRDEEEQAFLFAEQSYGMGQLAQTYPFEQYLNNYWRFFHATYPIIHRPTFESINQSPMLQAAMIAIGGQYSNDASVKRKSRILHDRCMKLLDKRELDILTEPERVSDWQALFLVETLSQYRARRAAHALSSRFETCYQKLCDSSREVASNLVNFAQTSPTDATYEQWARWIELSAQQRLLLCSYILEYQQATLLARNPQQSSIRSGLDLPLPAHSDLWDAATPYDWAMAARVHVHQPTFVFQVSSDLVQPFDTFQSSVLIATHYNHFNNPAPYLAPAPFAAIDHLLDGSPVVRHQLLTAKLLQLIPVRALLAVAGESWILSEKVPSPQIFTSYKSSLRAWINELWTGGSDYSKTQPVKEAMKLAVEILQHAMTAPAHALRLEMGADMGLYFAALTIWAATIAATSRITAPQGSAQPHRFQPHSLSPIPTARTNYPSTPSPFSANSPTTPNHSHATTLGLVTSHPTSSPISNSPSTSPSMQYPELTMLSVNFLSSALLELDMLGTVPQWPSDVTQWQQGCAVLLRWVKMRLRSGATEGADRVVVSATNVGLAGTGRGGDGFGELLDGVIGVIDTMTIRGWEGWGF